MITYLRCVLQFMHTVEGLKELAKLSTVPALLPFLLITGHDTMQQYSTMPALIILEVILYLAVVFAVFSASVLIQHILYYYYEAQDEKNSKQIPQSTSVPTQESCDDPVA